ncbi:MAG: hypothetical protein KIS87_06925 [Phycisphaeraceae bacterium]|nr:hypothetical protein [Phycisphaeraceae bacterium]
MSDVQPTTFLSDARAAVGRFTAQQRCSRGMTRRGVIVLIAGVAGVSAVGAALWPQFSGAKRLTHPWPILARELLPMDAAEWPALSGRCDAALAERGRPLDASSRVAGFEWDEIGILSGRDLQAVHAALAETIAREFGEGRVLVVDRWVLSETQAAMCALAGRAVAGSG